MSSLKTIVGIFGNLASISLFLTPGVVMFKRRMAGEVTVENWFVVWTYIASLLNCAIWIVYEMLKIDRSLLVLLINGFGIVIELLYIVIILCSTQRRTQAFISMAFAWMLAIFGALVMCIFFAIHISEARVIVAGVLCDVTGFAMYAGPFLLMSSTGTVPLYFSVIGFISSGLWLIYAIISVPYDVFMLVQDGCGILACSIQFALYFIIPRCCPLPAPEDAAPAPEAAVVPDLEAAICFLCSHLCFDESLCGTPFGASLSFF